MNDKKIRNCIFCNLPITKENRSREHVIPQWLLEFLDIREEKIYPTHFSSKGELMSSRNQILGNMVAGQVCESCNSGWMSQLEKDALYILKSLITGKAVVVDLDDNERQIIGRWTAKTAYTLNLCSNYLRNVPFDHLKHIKENSKSLPDKVLTCGQQNHGKLAFNWIQSPTWILNGNSNRLEDIGSELKNKSYKISFQFGKLVLLIAFIPIENIYPVLWKGIHIPLIPKSGKCGFYDKYEYPWSDSIQALNEFHLGLQAMYSI